MSRLSEEVAALEARLESMSADEKALDDRIRKIVKEVKAEDAIPESWDDIFKLGASLALLLAAIFTMVILLKYLFEAFP